MSQSSNIAAGIVALLLITGIGYYLVSENNSGYVWINVYSTHITRTVDVAVFIDDKQVDTFKDLKPGYRMYKSFKVKVPLFSDSKMVTIKAVSIGGGLGTQSDSKIIIIEVGKTQTVNLYV